MEDVLTHQQKKTTRVVFIQGPKNSPSNYSLGTQLLGSEGYQKNSKECNRDTRFTCHQQSDKYKIQNV